MILFTEPTSDHMSHSSTREGGLLSLPTEIILIAVDYIPDPSDLSALSRTCKGLHSMLVPDHTRFRALHIRHSDRPTLLTITEIPRLAGNIQRLSLSDGWISFSKRKGYYTPPEDIGSCYWDKELLECSGLYLPNLQEIHLNVVRIGQYEGFLNNLRMHSPHLVTFSLDVVWDDAGSDDEDPQEYGPKHPGADLSEEISVVGKLGGYTYFDWSYLHQVDHGGELICAIGVMLGDRCPRLQTLKIDAYNCFDDVVPPCEGFWEMRLPLLRSLDLRFVRPMENTGAFFDQLPLLESISWKALDSMSGDYPPIQISEGALPNLRDIHLDTFRDTHLLATLLNALPDGRRRPLSAVSYLNSNVINSNNVKALCQNIAVLRTLAKLHWEINSLDIFAQVAQAAAAVHWLELSIRRELLLTPEFAQALSGFQSLKTVKLKQFDMDDCVRRESLLSQMRSGCPTLCNVNGWVERNGLWAMPG